jgi:hypothetical protein
MSAGVNDRVRESSSTSAQDLEDEDYQFNPESIIEDDGNILDPETTATLHHPSVSGASDMQSNHPANEDDQSMHSTSGAPVLTRCLQGHPVYCSQCTAVHLTLGSDGPQES